MRPPSTLTLRGVTISASLREYAETPDRFAHVVPGASVERFADERICIIQGPTWASVSGASVGEDEVEALLADVRARVPADKEAVWWIGPSARPRDLYERLQALGLREPRDRVSTVHALVLTHAPARRRRESRSAASRRTTTSSPHAKCSGTRSTRPRTAARRTARFSARTSRSHSGSRSPLASSQRSTAGRRRPALAIPSDRGVFLIGGSTAAWARGRGLYRALVHARWEYAVARGTPALVTHAVPDTSYPILRRLGFEEVCTLNRLEDRLTDVS